LVTSSHGRLSVLVLGTFSGLLVVALTSQAARWHRSLPTRFHQPPPSPPPTDPPLLSLELVEPPP
jgi:hypothetical protein